MKLIQKASMVVVLVGLFALSSCHRYGCPGQITDTNLEQNTTVQTISDEDC